MLHFEGKTTSKAHKQLPSEDQQLPTEDQQPAPENQQETAENNSDPGPKKKKKKNVSQKQIEANRRNSQLSPGPRNTERTRHNPVQHGYCSQGITRLDDAEEYEETIRQLTSIYGVCDRLDEFLIQRAALEMVRVRRVARIEGENLEALCARLESSDRTLEQPAVDLLLMREYVGPLLDCVQRYDTAIANRLFRYIKELERRRQERSNPPKGHDKSSGPNQIV